MAGTAPSSKTRSSSSQGLAASSSVSASVAPNRKRPSGRNAASGASTRGSLAW